MRHSSPWTLRTVPLLAVAAFAAVPALAADSQFESAAELAHQVPKLRSTVSSDERQVSFSRVKELKHALRGARSLVAECRDRIAHPRRRELQRAIAKAVSELEDADESVVRWEAQFKEGTDVERAADAAQGAIQDAIDAWDDLDDEVERSFDALERQEQDSRRACEALESKADGLASKRDAADKKSAAEFVQLRRSYDAYTEACKARDEARREHLKAWGDVMSKAGVMDPKAFERLAREASKRREAWQKAVRTANERKLQTDREEADFERAAVALQRATDAHLAFLRDGKTLATVNTHNLVKAQLRLFREEYGDV